MRKRESKKETETEKQRGIEGIKERGGRERERVKEGEKEKKQKQRKKELSERKTQINEKCRELKGYKERKI